jgi:hypothetical protein
MGQGTNPLSRENAARKAVLGMSGGGDLNG